jgi:23S rRNA pseudouridine2605 synthase
VATERLSKVLVLCGMGSRRKSDEIVRSGRIKVNNVKIIEPWYQVNYTADIITCDNKRIYALTTKKYVLLNKPRGYLSDLAGTKDQKLARDLLKEKGFLFPVGRLDYNSEGLLIFTNDGDFANKVMHPRYGIEKEYMVKFSGVLSSEEVGLALRGLSIDGEPYRLKALKPVRTTAENSWYSACVTEGRNRIIRKIGEELNHPVLKLKRIRIGTMKLGSLRPGESRAMEAHEVESLLRQAAIPRESLHE